MRTSEKQVVTNIIKIRESLRLTKRDMADMLGMNETSYGRIESGVTALSFKHLADIAGCLQIGILDLITYPDRYVRVEEGEQPQEPIEAILQIKLQKSKKDQVLRLIFGDNDIELLNH